MMVLEKLVGVEKSEVVSWVSDAMEKLESSLLALMGVAQLKWNSHRHLSNIDCLSFVVCPLLAPIVIGFFFFAAAI